MLRTSGDHEHSDVSSYLREAFSFRRLRPLKGRKCSAPARPVLRRTSLRCAMSVPNHLGPDFDGAGQDQPAVRLPIRQGELPNDRQPEYIVGGLRSHERERDDVTSHISATIFQSANTS